MSYKFSQVSRLEQALAAPEQAPLQRELDDRFDEADVPRLWRGIEQRSQRRGRSRLQLSLAALLLSVSLFFAGREALQRVDQNAPLELTAGAVPAVLETTHEARTIRLNDGSNIELGGSARLGVLHNDGHAFVSILHQGTGTFDIKPGGPRRWVVQAGPLSVEVLGTRFQVAREARGAKVSVERGVVLVRGAGLDSNGRRLVAGESIELPNLDLAQSAAAANMPSEPAPSVVASASLGDATLEPTSVVTSAPLDSETRERTPQSSLSAVPEPHNVSQPASATSSQPAAAGQLGASELDLDVALADADAARRRGDLATAATIFEDIVRRAPASDPRRGIAALSLARLTARSAPERAAAALKASSASMPKGLEEDALARRVQAAAELGDRDDARRLAEEYLARFPNGHRAEDVRRWLEP